MSPLSAYFFILVMIKYAYNKVSHLVRHTISIPDPMSQYINHQVQSGQYGNVSEYIRDLVRKDQEQKKLAIAELRAMLDKAEESGISNLSMNDIRTRAQKRAGR